jgi:hypothetical protein
MYTEQRRKSTGQKGNQGYWKTIFTQHVSDKWLLYTINRELKQLNNEVKTTIIIIITICHIPFRL